MKWIDATHLDQWADRRDSQALLPEVVRRLVFATVGGLRRVLFPSGESVQLPGWDIKKHQGKRHVGTVGVVEERFPLRVIQSAQTLRIGSVETQGTDQRPEKVSRYTH
jgi:hypothetical protein